MLKKSACGVLASLRGSTYRSVRLAFSLAAALLDSLFEHPAAILKSVPYERFQWWFMNKPGFFRSLLEESHHFEFHPLGELTPSVERRRLSMALEPLKEES